MSLSLLAGALAAALVVYWTVVPPRLRAGFLLGGSLAGIGLLGWPVAAAFLALVLVTWAVAGRAGGAAVVGLLGILLFFKLVNPALALLPEHLWGGALLPLGLSYVVFRLISYAVDVGRGVAPRGSPVEVATYALFLPAFLAGPVDRFGRIHPQLDAPAFDLLRFQQGLQRALVGIVKKALLADPLAAWLAPLYAAPDEAGVWLLLASAVPLAVQIYLDFSGYTDLAIGVGAMFGLRLTENFDRPWLSENIAAFWRRWHISVSEFIRDYFFLPVFAYRPRPWKIRLGVFTTLFVFMVWHGATWSFVLLGVWHGGAMLAWQVLQDVKRRRPALRRAIDDPRWRWAWRLVTLLWVSVGFLAFELDLGVLLGLPGAEVASDAASLACSG